MKSYTTMDTYDILHELNYGERFGISASLLARRLDVPKRKIGKLIEKARQELYADPLNEILIMTDGQRYWKEYTEEAKERRHKEMMENFADD